MLSLNKQLAQKKGKIVWLTSYPKSGNTWFRFFLSALFTQKVDINELHTDGILSLRIPFDQFTNLDSSLLHIHEIRNLLPRVYRKAGENASKLLFIKVHDAFIYNDNHEPIIPLDITHKVIYFIRNPLDIVTSFAHHSAYNLEQTITLMNSPNGTLALQDDGLHTNNQFPQLMFDWSGHVNSWTKHKELDVSVIRYEDMLHNSLSTFKGILESIGLKATDKQIQVALELCSFERLKNQEKESAFLEKNPESDSFFRNGKSGGWKEELTPQQVQSITECHAEVMKTYDYLPK